MYLYHVLLYILVQLKYLLSIQGSVISEKPTCNISLILTSKLLQQVNPLHILVDSWYISRRDLRNTPSSCPKQQIEISKTEGVLFLKMFFRVGYISVITTSNENCI